MSFEPRLAAALSGVSLGQLRYWRRAHGKNRPLLVPEMGEGRALRYSFRDVLALRAMAYLREEVSLQRIRKAFATLDGWGKNGHPSQYALVAHGDTILLREAAHDAIDLVQQPGQRVIAQLVDVLAEFDNLRGVRVPDFRHPRPQLEVDEGVLGGLPVISGTRIPYDFVADLVEDGVPPQRVRTYYPNVSPSAALDAVDYQNYVRAVA